MTDMSEGPVPRSGEDPIDVVLWGLRSHLIALESGDDAVGELERVYSRAHLASMNAALCRLAQLITTMRAIEIDLHHPRCPCMAWFERLFVSALRHLQQDNLPGYEEAMGSVVQTGAVKLAMYDMEIVADSLARLEQRARRQMPSRIPDNVVHLHEYASTRVH
ncbi:MAG: hypothetical protein AAF610_05790 [Pseudomonadota bacterium]